MEALQIYFADGYWYVEGAESQIEFAACETREIAEKFAGEMVTSGEASSFVVDL